MSSNRVNPALLAIRREGAAKGGGSGAQGSLFGEAPRADSSPPTVPQPTPPQPTPPSSQQAPAHQVPAQTPPASEQSAKAEPPPAPEKPTPLSVSQLTNQLRNLVERTFYSVLVTGEITGLKPGHGGHCYFALKDDGAKLDAVMWRRDYTALKFKLESGMQVVARGKLAIYPPHGKYQLMIDRIEPVGAGALAAAFEQLKARLSAEGLFAAERKRPLSLLPRTVAVVTSPNGAVIRDIVNVATRRFPQARLLLIPAKVQGPDAAATLVQAIKRASAMAARADISAVIVARGGGSAEELWCFNDEKVVRAISACTVPVVSAVGHETDFTISDFVADVRAPTPSAAAELVWPVAHEVRSRLSLPVARMQRSLRRDIARDRRRLEHAKRSLGDGRRLVRDSAQRLDAALARMTQALSTRVRDDRLLLQRAIGRIERSHPAAHLAAAHARLAAAQARINASMRATLKDQRSALDDLGKRMAGEIRSALKDDRARLGQSAARLHALSPLAVLTRGYSLTRTVEGKVVSAASDVAIGERVDIRVARGQIRAVVESTSGEADSSRDRGSKS